MKTKAFYLVSILMIVLLLSVYLFGRNIPKRNMDPSAVTLINEEINLYRSGDFYFGGQPPEEALQWLQSQGVSLIINLRSDEEMAGLIGSGMNEDSLVHALGMKYIRIPMAGQEGFNPEALAEFTKVLEENPGKVFIHCYGCYRVSYLMMAWLIREKNYPLNEVLSFGKKMKYFSPLEGLLGKELIL